MLTPPNTRIYAIGDVHGRLDLLTHLHEKIIDDVRTFNGRTVIVHLGDYVDRGVQSRQVLEYLIGLALPAIETIHLKGNHEEVMLQTLSVEEVMQSWLLYGGRETLASYGVDANQPIPALMAAFQKALPDAHRDFLENLPLSYSLGDYFFVHAGVNPHFPFSQQQPADLLWSREPFLSHNKRLEKMVVHGHTITAKPVAAKHRIGIDTGAYKSNILTALRLEGRAKKFITTGN